MDKEKLKAILNKIEAVTNTDYDNDAEHLKSLQNWVHSTKEGGEAEAGAKAFVDERGLSILVECVKLNRGDTVVANRALEILAGESHSNGALLITDHGKYCVMLAELGYMEVLFEMLRLPDLQAISRGLACRALRAICRHDPKVVDSHILVNGDELVGVLMDQVFHADRPFVFGVLAEVTRHNSKGRDLVRNSPGSLKMCLTKFSEKPNDHSPEEDPQASMLFISTWSWDELKKEMSTLGDREMETEDVLRKDYAKIYKWYNGVADVISPMLDYSTELANTYFYIKTGKYQFLALATVGILLNTTMSTLALTHTKTGACWKMLVNVVTFGYYNILREGRKCYKHGLRSDALTGLKTFKSVNSMIRFFVGTYSLLLAGYLDGYPELTGAQLSIRWLSVASSLFFIPLTCMDTVAAKVLPGKRDYGQAFRGWSRQSSFSLSLLLYQGSEISAQVSLLIFQMVARPVGIFVLWGVQMSLVFLFVVIRGGCRCSRYTLVSLPQALFWTTNGGATTELQIMSRAGSFLRVVSLLSAWVWIYIRMDDHPRLKEHLQYHSNLALLAISMGGTIMHVLCYVQQLYMGRWKFEDIDMQHSLYDRSQTAGNYRELQEVGDREAGGLYDTAASAPYLVAERWKMVHELLPEATSRVPRAEFISTHKKIAMKSAAVGTTSLSLSSARKSRTEYAADEQSAFHAFLTTLFTAATGLMLPKQKDDLGKHCYGYSSLVTDEYYESPDLPPDNLGLLKAPAIGWFDPLKVLRVNLQDDWSHVVKDEHQHVDLKCFKHVVTKRHFQKLGGIDEAAKAFETFLERIFEAVRLIGGRSDQQWIDQHGFIYGGLLAYEFYFADARDHEKAEGCGCSTPVADNLGITAALATKKA